MLVMLVPDPGRSVHEGRLMDKSLRHTYPEILAEYTITDIVQKMTR